MNDGLVAASSFKIALCQTKGDDDDDDDEKEKYTACLQRLGQVSRSAKETHMKHYRCTGISLGYCAEEQYMSVL